MQMKEELTWSITDGRVEWGTDNSNIISLVRL